MWTVRPTLILGHDIMRRVVRFLPGSLAFRFARHSFHMIPTNVRRYYLCWLNCFRWLRNEILYPVPDCWRMCSAWLMMTLVGDVIVCIYKVAHCLYLVLDSAVNLDTIERMNELLICLDSTYCFVASWLLSIMRLGFWRICLGPRGRMVLLCE